MIPSPPPFTQLPTGKRSIVDRMYYRVYALENRMSASRNGVELEWYVSRSITLRKPLRGGLFDGTESESVEGGRGVLGPWARVVRRPSSSASWYRSSPYSSFFSFTFFPSKELTTSFWLVGGLVRREDRLEEPSGIRGTKSLRRYYPSGLLSMEISFLRRTFFLLLYPFAPWSSFVLLAY